MKPLGILYLYRVRLRARLVQEALAALGIAVGVALLFASQVASTSLTGSVRQLTSGVVGQSRLQLQARGSQGFPEQLLGQVQRLPGVRSAAPVLEIQANVVGPDGQQWLELLGADPRFVHLGGRLLQHFSVRALAHQHAVALPEPIAQRIGVGALQPITLQIGARSVNVLVGVTLQVADIGALAHSPVVLAPLAYAQQLAHMKGRVTRIFVQPQPGRDREVRQELTHLAGGRLNVLPANFDSTLFQKAAIPIDQSTGLFAAISALVGFLFAFNAMMLTVPARRRLVADLRLDGYSPVTVVEVLLFDALALGVVSVLFGLLLGNELSSHLFHPNPGYLSLAFPVGSPRIVTLHTVVLAALTGIVAACVGVLTPLRDIFSLRPLAVVERKPSSLQRAYFPPLGGGVCLILTTIILIAAPQHAIVGVISLTVALLLLLPSLLNGLLLTVEKLTFDVKAKAPFVAVHELRSPSTHARTLAIAATGAIAVFGSVAIQAAHRDLQTGLNWASRQINDVTDLWVSPAANTLATAPFNGTNIKKTLSNLPSVASINIYRGSLLNVGDHRAWVIAPSSASSDLIPPSQLVHGNLGLATRRLRGGGWIAVSQVIADQDHLHIGQSLTLPTPQPKQLRLAAITTNFGWSPGVIVLNANDYVRAWGNSDISAFQIKLKSDISPTRGQREVQQALGPGSPLVVQTAYQREQADRATQQQGLARLNQISTLVLIAAILAMAAAMGNMIWQRRSRLARLKLDGYTSFELWRTLLLESALLLSAGCSIGAVFGLYGQLLGSHAILSVTGFPVVFSFGVAIALSSFALVATVAVLIVAIPGYLAARVQPSAGL